MHDKVVIFLTCFSDALIALSYFLIPGAMFAIILMRRVSVSVLAKPPTHPPTTTLLPLLRGLIAHLPLPFSVCCAV
jgi:hypothetical protein